MKVESTVYEPPWLTEKAGGTPPREAFVGFLLTRDGKTLDCIGSNIEPQEREVSTSFTVPMSVVPLVIAHLADALGKDIILLERVEEGEHET